MKIVELEDGYAFFPKKGAESDAIDLLRFWADGKCGNDYVGWEYVDSEECAGLVVRFPK